MPSAIKTRVQQPSPAAAAFEKHDRRVLVLQGGGALGAYQAGVYEGLVEAGFAPNWVAGVSIGAINAALIGGNPPERRIERIHEFWNRVSTGSPFVFPAGKDFALPIAKRMSAAAVAAFGIPDGLIRKIEALRSTLADVLAKLPESLLADPQVQKLAEGSQRGPLSLIHLINRHDTGSADFKDYDFSRTTIEDLWRGGQRDVQKVLEHPSGCRVTDYGNEVRLFEI